MNVKLDGTGLSLRESEIRLAADPPGGNHNT